jgi:hypothetical protein
MKADGLPYTDADGGGTTFTSLMYGELPPYTNGPDAEPRPYGPYAVPVVYP